MLIDRQFSMAIHRHFSVAIDKSTSPAGGLPVFGLDGRARLRLGRDLSTLAMMVCGNSQASVGATGRSHWPFAYSSADRGSNSNPTNRASPTTHASWPGSMTYDSPGPILISVGHAFRAVFPPPALPRFRAPGDAVADRK